MVGGTLRAAHHADAGGGPRHVRTVAVAVERVIVGLRRRGRAIGAALARGGRTARAVPVGAGVVAVAREVVAADDLGRRECRGRRAPGAGLRAARPVEPVVAVVVGRGARATEVGVVVVDAAVDDRDPDAGTGEPGRTIRAPRLLGTDERVRVGVGHRVTWGGDDPRDTGAPRRTQACRGRRSPSARSRRRDTAR